MLMNTQPYLPMLVQEVLDQLISSSLGWTCQADRFYYSRTEYILRKRFRPLTDLNDAFRLLESIKPTSYMIVQPPGGRPKVSISTGPMQGALATAATVPEAIVRACMAVRSVDIPHALLNVSMAEIYASARE